MRFKKFNEAAYLILLCGIFDLKTPQGQAQRFPFHCSYPEHEWKVSQCLRSARGKHTNIV